MFKVPQYKQLYHLLKEQILSGHYQEGDLLPSENELSQLHQLNRATVRQALGELVKEALITKQHGKGSIVNYKKESLDLLSFRGFTDVVGATPHRAKSVFINRPYLSKWEADFFYELSDKEKETGCIRLDRIRYVDEHPVMLEYTFLPNWDLAEFCNTPLVNESLFNTLQINYKINIINVRQELRAIKADQELSDLLKVEINAPILLIYRRYDTSRENFYVYSILFCNTEQYAIGSVFS